MTGSSCSAHLPDSSDDNPSRRLSLPHQLDQSENYVIHLRSDTLVFHTRTLVERSGRQVFGRYQSLAAICPSQTPFAARSGPLTAAGAHEATEGQYVLNRAARPMAVAHERSPTFCSRS